MAELAKQLTKNRKIGRSKDDILFDTLNTIFLSLALILVLYPLYFVVIASISEPVAVQSGAVTFFPVDVTFEGFEKIFGYDIVWIGYLNTIIYVTIHTTLAVVMTLMTAYPLSRKTFLGKKFFLFFLMFTMYFSGGMIPLYLQMKNLNLINSMWSVIFIGMISVYNVIITKTFLQSSIPEELYEAAAIDGCNHFRFFALMILPLSKSIIAVMVLYYGIAMWNDYFNAMLYLTDSIKFPLQLILKSILAQNEVSSDMLAGSDFENEIERQRIVDLMRYGLIIVSTIPVLIIYPFLQKYFVKGVMIGSVKG